MVEALGIEIDPLLNDPLPPNGFQRWEPWPPRAAQHLFMERFRELARASRSSMSPSRTPSFGADVCPSTLATMKDHPMKLDRNIAASQEGAIRRRREADNAKTGEAAAPPVVATPSSAQSGDAADIGLRQRSRTSGSAYRAGASAIPKRRALEATRFTSAPRIPRPPWRGFYRHAQGRGRLPSLMDNFAIAVSPACNTACRSRNTSTPSPLPASSRPAAFGATTRSRTRPRSSTTFPASSPSPTFAETISLMFREPLTALTSAACKPLRRRRGLPKPIPSLLPVLRKRRIPPRTSRRVFLRQAHVTVNATVAVTSAGEKARRREDARLRGYTGGSARVRRSDAASKDDESRSLRPPLG